jgi:hypothetical protein
MIQVIDSNGNLKNVVLSCTTIGSAIQAISAGTAAITSGTLIFSNSNGVSFGANGQTITASFLGGGGAGSVNFSAGTTSNNLTNIVYSNSNGVSFGLNGSTITATVATNYQSQGAYLTTAMLSNAGSNFVGLNSALTGNGVSATINSSGISIDVPAFLTTAQPVGAYLTTAMLSNAVTLSNINVSAGTTSNNLSALTFDNSNGVSFGLDNGTITATVATNYQSQGAYLTTARASNDAIGLNSALTANGVSVTANSSGLSLNFPAFLTTAQPVGAYLTTAMLSNAVTLSNIKLSAGTLSALRSDLTFNNSNGVSFGLETNGIITATVATNYQSQGAYLTTARASNDAIGLNTAQSNVTWTVNSSGLSINAAGYAGTGTTFNGANISGSITQNSNGINLSLSAAAPGGGGAINVSAGTTSGNLQTIQFDNGGGVSFGLNGSTVTASVNGGGGNTISTYIPYYPASTGVQTMGAQGVTSASAWFFPFPVEDAVRFNRIEQLMTASWISTTVAASNTITHQFGLFTNNAGTLSLISSSSYSVAASNSSISATVSYPSAYGTAGGYTYTTVGASSTATAQLLFGTAGNRVMTFGFGNTMELSAGLYWLGIHQRQSSAGAAAGMAFALAGNVMVAWQNAGGLGSSTAAYTGTNNTLYKVPWGVATSTGSAGYGGSVLPSAVNITAMGMTVTNMPMMTFISR